jgi:hypothetical protein
MVRHLAALAYRRRRAIEERARLAADKCRADHRWQEVRGHADDREWERLLASAQKTTEYAQASWHCRQAQAAWRRAFHGVIAVALADRTWGQDQEPTGAFSPGEYP